MERNTTQTDTQSDPTGGYFDVPGGGLPRNEAIGASAGLVAGITLSWAVYGAALSSAPVFALTVGITLPMIVIGQRLAGLKFDAWFLYSLALVTLAFAPAVLG